MAEHWIRLRGGWIHEKPGSPPGRVALPIFWTPGLRAPFRLIRRFQRPPFDPRSETLHLRMEGVAGLVMARLNDSELARPSAGASGLDVILDATLPPTNLLVLDVDPAGWDEVEARVSPWGAIALVVGSA